MAGQRSEGLRLHRFGQQGCVDPPHIEPKLVVTASYPIEVNITKNTLAVMPGDASGGTSAHFVIDMAKLPPASNLLFAGNDVTTADPANWPILSVENLVAIPATSTFRVHRNALKAMDGATGAQPGTLVVKHNANTGFEASTGPISLCGNSVLETLINTEALAQSTFLSESNPPFPTELVAECVALPGDGDGSSSSGGSGSSTNGDSGSGAGSVSSGSGGSASGGSSSVGGSAGSSPSGSGGSKNGDVSSTDGSGGASVPVQSDGVRSCLNV